MKRLGVLVLIALSAFAARADAALISRVTTWSDGQVLTHTALNAEIDNLLNEINGSLTAANLAADSVGASELAEADDYTIQNLILTAAGPDIRWTPTSGDTFHAGAEYAAATGSIWFLSNSTDGVRYLEVSNAHVMTYGHASVPYHEFLTDGTGDNEFRLPLQGIGQGELVNGLMAFGRITRTAGNITTTSTSLVDLTGISVTVTTGANPLLVGCTITSSNSTASVDRNGYVIDIDGTDYQGTTGVTTEFPLANNEENLSFTILTDALVSGLHTVKLQWLVSSGTGTTYCNSDIPCHLWAMEVLN